MEGEAPKPAADGADRAAPAEARCRNQAALHLLRARHCLCGFASQVSLLGAKRWLSQGRPANGEWITAVLNRNRSWKWRRMNSKVEKWMTKCVFPKMDRPPYVFIYVQWAGYLVWIYEDWISSGRKGVKTKSWFQKKKAWTFKVTCFLCRGAQPRSYVESFAQPLRSHLLV